MKTLKLLTFSILTLLLALPFLVEARPMDDRAVLSERDIFETTLYPFMKKNCIECHGELAVYPAGPAHTHSNVNTAFKTFSKFVNKNDFAKSGFIKYASNKHFCKEFGVNCPQQNQIVEELSNLFASYSTKAKALQGNGMSTGTVITGTKQDLKKSIKIGNSNFRLYLYLKKFSDEYWKVASINMTSLSAAEVSFDGIEILVNGQLPPKSTGLEKLIRNLKFENFSMATQLIHSRQIIIPLKEGDRLEFQLKNARVATHAPSEICKDPAKRATIANFLNVNEILLTQFKLNVFGVIDVPGLNDEMICNQLMLQVHLKHPSQSIFVKQTEKVAQIGATNLIKKINSEILNSGAGTPKKTDRQNIESIHSNYRTTCFKLADGSVTCFGKAAKGIQTYSANDFQVFGLGTASYAYVNKSGSIVLPVGPDDAGTYPNELSFTGSYPFAEKITDLQVGFEISCFLTEKKDVYCGGQYLAGTEYGSGRDKFVKVSTVPIKQISLNLRRLIMISEADQIYIFKKEDPYSSELQNITAKENEMLGLLKVDYVVKEIFQGFNQFCFKDSNGKLRCYSNGARGLFGSDYIDGTILAQDLSFKQIAIMSTKDGSCGLTENGELWCAGSFPSGLSAENGDRYTDQYRKVVNAPAEIKLLASSDDALFMVTKENFIYSATHRRDSFAGLSTSGRLVDNQGRSFYSGPNASMSGGTLSPYIKPPIQ